MILFRHKYEEEEQKIAKQYLDCTDSRIGINNQLVIARYSCLPYYQELENDLKLQNSRLINSYEEHRYIASFDYYNDIKDLTPELIDLSTYKGEGPFIVKGSTNSKKFDWNSMMFAKNREDAIKIKIKLQQDSLIGYQDIIVRKYEKLKILEVGINGLPFSNEWRFFCYKDKILSYGFYWVISSKMGVIDNRGFDLVKKVIQRVRDKVNFFVVDIAETENGDWIVIELNDGQMSGLSGNNPHELYKNLAKVNMSYT